jgi:hypothetical protein
MLVLFAGLGDVDHVVGGGRRLDPVGGGHGCNGKSGYRQIAATTHVFLFTNPPRRAARVP